VFAIGSSALGEPSWSYVADSTLGLSVIDRFTHFTLQFLERVSAASSATLGQLLDSCAPLSRAGGCVWV
jgi:phosphatidylinositol glycan class K